MEEYRDAKTNLSRAIRTVKIKAWEELIDTLEEDPWGRPYRLVLNRLRSWTPPITELMTPELLDEVMRTLFPVPRGMNNPPLLMEPGRNVHWEEDILITEGEWRRAITRLGKTHKAPGPDGIPGRVWSLVMAELAGPLHTTLQGCLRKGVFPLPWRRSRLVLIQKEGREPGTPSAFRPICLIDEVAKFFQRIVASQISKHLEKRGPNLHPQQYGFREERSTTDAIIRVKSVVGDAVERGGVVLAISLDIVNAFNSLPWREIGSALQHHKIPPHIIRVVRDYFRSRAVLYSDADGRLCSREMFCGVSQGSVLGPLLWNLAYDRVLRTALPQGCQVV